MFTVVITHFNRPEYLLRCLSAIDVSSSLIDKVIVVDNGSSEKILEVVQRTVKKTKKTDFISHPTGNANSARNAGYKYASSEWICFCDDDDYFSKDKFSVISKAVSDNPNVQVVYNALKVELLGTSLSYVTNPSVPSIKMNYKDFVFNRLGSTSGLTIKKDLLHSIGGFDEDLNSLQDYELYIRLALNESKLIVIDEPLTIYYKGSGSGQVSSGVERVLQSFDYIENKHPLLLNAELVGRYSSWKDKLVFQKAVDSGLGLFDLLRYGRVGWKYKLICYARRTLMKVVRWFIRLKS